jgi:hypothetical protein
MVRPCLKKPYTYTNTPKQNNLLYLKLAKINQQSKKKVFVLKQFLIPVLENMSHETSHNDC